MLFVLLKKARMCDTVVDSHDAVFCLGQSVFVIFVFQLKYVSHFLMIESHGEHVLYVELL